MLTQQYAQQLWQILESGSLTIGDKTMRFQYFVKGDQPQGGYTLFFGFHGGGDCPSELNEDQYNNHLHLYD